MNTGGLDPKQVQAWRELEDLARQMREAQSEYFKGRTQSALARSKKLERLVDAKLMSLRTVRRAGARAGRRPGRPSVIPNESLKALRGDTAPAQDDAGPTGQLPVNQAYPIDPEPCENCVHGRKWHWGDGKCQNACPCEKYMAPATGRE